MGDVHGDRNITVFGERRAGEPRIRQFEIPMAVVQVQPRTDTNDAAFAVLCDVVHDSVRTGVALAVRLMARAQAAEDLARDYKAALAVQVDRHPPEPEMLLGDGCVRWNERGEMWFLNRRETGWSSNGFRVDGWDEVFRRWRAVVRDVGRDDAGPYVVVGPKAVA